MAPANNRMLTSKCATSQAARNIKYRMKHPRLVGADLYVARFITSLPPTKKEAGASSVESSNSNQDGMDTDSDNCGLHALPPMTEQSTGSLYDELTCNARKKAAAAAGAGCQTRVKSSPRAAESRPCYRCISYMYTHGIKRVFWTNNEGRWECAKVRDLVDLLGGDSSAGNLDSDVSDGGGALSGVFVTKHEVLMLRRTMGASG